MIMLYHKSPANTAIVKPMPSAKPNVTATASANLSSVLFIELIPAFPLLSHVQSD
jgi:hypothetical protein